MVRNNSKIKKPIKIDVRSNYRIDFPKKAKHLISKGLTERETAKLMDIPYSSYEKYKRDYIDFKVAVEEGKKLQKNPTKNGPTVEMTDDFLNQVYQLALLGCTDKEMVEVLGICQWSFSMYKRAYPEFKKSIENGRLLADSRVAASMFHNAVGYSHPDIYFYPNRVKEYDEETGKLIREYTEVIQIPITKHYPPNSSAGIWWMKNRTRIMETPWTDALQVEHTGKDGNAIEINHNIDLSKLSTEQLEVAKELIPEFVLAKTNIKELLENNN